jgi:hypothetical protein
VESLALTTAAAAAACMIGNWIASALPPEFAGQSNSRCKIWTAR